MIWRVLVPLLLFLAAGGLNYWALYRGTAPLDLVAVRQDTKAGTELTDEMLEKVSVRADRKLFASAVAYADRGILIRAKLGRPLKSSEVILFADVRQDAADDVRPNLRSDETSRTVLVRQGHVAPNLRPGDMVVFLVQADAAGKGKSGEAEPPREVGPFRLAGLGERGDMFQSAATGREEYCKVVIVVPKPQTEAFKALEAALVQPPGAERPNRVLGVEHAAGR